MLSPAEAWDIVRGWLLGEWTPVEDRVALRESGYVFLPFDGGRYCLTLKGLCLVSDHCCGLAAS